MEKPKIRNQVISDIYLVSQYQSKIKSLFYRQIEEYRDKLCNFQKLSKENLLNNAQVFLQQQYQEHHKMLIGTFQGRGGTLKNFLLPLSIAKSSAATALPLRSFSHACEMDEYIYVDCFHGNMLFKGKFENSKFTMKLHSFNFNKQFVLLKQHYSFIDFGKLRPIGRQSRGVNCILIVYQLLVGDQSCKFGNVPFLDFVNKNNNTDTNSITRALMYAYESNLKSYVPMPVIWLNITYKSLFFWLR